MKLFSLSPLLWLFAENLTAASDVMDRNPNAPWSICGCQGCEMGVWNTDAGGFSCGARISYLVDASGFAASRACRTVSAAEFPNQCGSCNPDTCVRLDGTGQESLSAPAPNVNLRCGCDLCEKYAWQVNAGGYSCGERINFLLSLPNLYPTEADACRQVAKMEYPAECGLCSPDRCDGTAPPPPPKPQDHEPPTELYCFPTSEKRTRYSNVWGKYTLEVKEGDVCGPSDNLFSKSGVSVDYTKSELTMQLAKQSDGRWHASEVRILLPAGKFYDYGRYSFSVKRIQVIDTLTDGLVSSILPPSVVLGLFTWDDTKDYSIKEAYNQEVDIEISRWDIRDNEDIQFLVQPPGNPQMYRFYSKSPPTLSLPVYDQAPHVHEFEWKPAEINWSSTAGGGQAFTYGTQEALNAGRPDYIQCMPANVEVRINLWNLLGNAAPTDMEDHHIVEVVIDKFEYEPSGQTALPTGGVCSKDCQCGDLQCVQNRCMDASWTTIAAASGGEEEQKATSSFWRDNRWVILGALVGLAILIAIITVMYYRRERYKPAVIFGSWDKSEHTDEEEGDSESFKNDPYMMGTRVGGETVALADTNAGQLPVVTVEDEIELFQAATLPQGVEEAESTTCSDSSLFRLVNGENEKSFHFGD